MHENKYVTVVKNEIERLGSIKVSFGLSEDFSRVNYETDEQQTITHYFQRDQPTVFVRGDSKAKIRFREFIRPVKGETDNCSEAGSEGVAGDIDLAYINVARYQPSRGGTYLPLLAGQAKRRQ